MLAKLLGLGKRPVATKPLRRMSPHVIYHIVDGKVRLGANADMRGDHYYMLGDCTGISGDCTGLMGTCSGIVGNVSGVYGNCSDISGDCTGINGDIETYVQ